MQDIRQVIAKHGQSAPIESSPSTPLAVGTTDRLARLWVVMTELYGKARWEAEHGTTPNDRVARQLGALSVEQLRAGIARCRSQVEAAVERGERVWPPTLYELITHCRLGVRVEPAHQPRPKQLPEPELSAAERKAKFAEAVATAAAVTDDDRERLLDAYRRSKRGDA